MENLAQLLDKEQKLLKQIRKNRDNSKNLLSNNRQLRRELGKVGQEIIDIVTSEMDEGKKSLYQVVKDSLGVIDGRYNRIYDLINKGNLTK